MMAYVDQGDPAAHQDNIIRLVSDLMEALQSPEAKSKCISFAQNVATGQFYKALNDCRWLINYETGALQRAEPTAA
jgi:flagellar protein FlbT